MGETKYHFLWNDKLAAKMQQANFNTKVPFIAKTVLSQGRLLEFILKSAVNKTFARIRRNLVTANLVRQALKAKKFLKAILNLLC